MATPPLPPSPYSPRLADGTSLPAPYVVAYTPAHAAAWNAFVATARNATFLFERGYLDYHADRFRDCSTLCYDAHNRLVAVLPANRSGDSVYSHQGLTYGGLVCAPHLTAGQTLLYFDLLNAHYRRLGAARLIYKPLPTMYSAYPSEEDRYCMFRLGAVRTGCALATVVSLTNPYPFTARRLRGLRRAMAASVTITTPTDFGPYWALLTDHLLRRYRAAPVHSLAEMHGLRARFPDRIRLYQANVADEPVGGVVVYFTGRVARAQYIAASAEGRRCGALDRVFDHLLRTELAAPSPVAYFDFGASTEQNGHYLNAGVIGHKEGFGGRGIVYEQYEYDLLTAPRLLPAT